MTINFRTPDEPEVEGIDYDELDEIIQDAISNDEGRLGPLSLQHYLLRRGWTIGRAEAHNYPRPMERLGPIVPGRAPRDHVHVWTLSWCRECGEDRPTLDKQE